MSSPTIPDSSGPTLLTNLTTAFLNTWKAMQTQDATAWTSAGTAPAFTLTPTPALTAYAAGQRFRVKFSANATAPTLNVSALGAKSVKMLNTLGVKIAAVIYANALLDCEYDGTDFVVLNPCQPKSNGGYRNYKASCSGASASIPMTADLVTLRDAAGSYIELAGVSVTLNTAGSGANGMQAAVAINTWYDKGIIYNPTSGATAAFGWAQGATPTLPSGYTHWMRMGSFRTDGSGSKYPLACQWTNARMQIIVTAAGNVVKIPLVCSGAQGTSSQTTPTWATVSVAAFVPPTATRISLVLNNNYAGGTVGDIQVAPNANYAGAANAGGNFPPAWLWGSSRGAIMLDMALESTNIYVASAQAGAAVGCLGYEDVI